VSNTETLFSVVSPAESTAHISPDGLYRYYLLRRWGSGSSMTFVMLNPSTADETKNDHTIRRCIFYAKREGFDAIEVINLYALRCTRPVHLLDHPDPEGPGNRFIWDRVLQHDGPVVAAWGASRPKECPQSEALNDHAVEMLDWLCLGVTDNDDPRHPSRLPNEQPLKSYGRRTR
jgi:hypothetical protein